MIAGVEVETAQKITVALEDDLTGGPVDETVRFAFEGHGLRNRRERQNAAAFHKQLVSYLEHARKTGRAQARRAGRGAANREPSADIRAWAKEHGLAVSERGRIPATVWSSTTLRAADASAGTTVPRGARTHAWPWPRPRATVRPAARPAFPLPLTGPIHPPSTAMAP